MTGQDQLLVTKEGSVCTLTINRPDRRNALTTEIFLQLRKALRSIGEDGETRVAVLRGAGNEAFSSGYDITQISSSTDRLAKDAMEDVILALETCPLPVIAMIYGYCVGAGLGLAVSCDFCLAADNSRLGVTPAKLGAGYPASAILRFINVIGAPATRELFYTGRLIDAERAKEIRLVHQVVPGDHLATVTYDLARQIADNAPLSIRNIKIAISRLLSYQAMSPEIRSELLALEKQAADSEDLKEGQRAFLEKRKPVFKGR